MAKRQFGLYFSWSRPDEIGAALGNLDNRFPALFELRRILWPEFEKLANSSKFDQGIAGFLDDVVLSDFQFFMEHIRSETGTPVRLVQRKNGTDAAVNALDTAFLEDIDTLVVVSLDHQCTTQRADATEIENIAKFLADPDHTLLVSPHHDVGDVSDLPLDQRLAAKEAEHRHHGDVMVPAEQRLSGFARSLLQGLGVEVENRFGLNPAYASDGSPAPLDIITAADRFKLLEGVSTFNLHPHLPHFEPHVESREKFDVLARQPINPTAPPHPFVHTGRHSFDALLQTRLGIFSGRLLVCDATVWSSAFGGLRSLQRFWTNIAKLPRD